MNKYVASRNIASLNILVHDVINFMKIFENLDSFKFLSQMIKDGKYLPQKIHQGSIVIESK